MLLVDAYNVLFAWKQLYPRDMVADMLMEDARFRLEEDLAAYSQLRQVKVVVVYDAMYRASDPAYLDIRRTTRYVYGLIVLPCSKYALRTHACHAMVHATMCKQALVLGGRD